MKSTFEKELEELEIKKDIFTKDRVMEARNKATQEFEKELNKLLSRDLSWEKIKEIHKRHFG